MNPRISRFVTSAAVPALLFAAAATAHDGKEHAQPGAEKPDCAAMMKDMDMSKMDMSDPAMKAMHEKCMAGRGMEGMEGMHPSQPKGKEGDKSK